MPGVFTALKTFSTDEDGANGMGNSPGAMLGTVSSALSGAASR